MAQNSKIEWCHHTANIWWGCTHVHAGCDHCYAEAMSKRYGKDVWGSNKSRRAIQSVWDALEKYQRLAEEAGEIHRVFVGSMQDIFEKPMPLIDSKGNKMENITTGDLRDEFFNQVPNYPNLMFLLLTKRPSNINKYIPKNWKKNPPANVMFGTSPVNQETADNLILHLSKVNGQRFISAEPQLAPINLLAPLDKNSNKKLIDCLDWVINGGESGHNKRPFDTNWARQIKRDCKKKKVPFFFKQIDKIQEIPKDLLIRQFPPAPTKQKALLKKAA